MEAAIADDNAFELGHALSKRRYCNGHPDTVFPLGTYGFKVNLGVQVASRRATA